MGHQYFPTSELNLKFKVSGNQHLFITLRILLMFLHAVKIE